MKLERLLAITMLLLNRKRITAKELSERFEVSLRTIYRDLETINMAGIPVVSYAGMAGGYELTERYGIERQYLSLDELQSIMTALRGIRTAMDETHVAGLLDKVGALLNHTEQHYAQQRSRELIIDINPWHQNDPAEPSRLPLIRQAVREQRIVAFSYTDGQGQLSERKVELYSVVLKGYVWYAYGYCRMREDFRTFRLTRIMDLRLEDDRFEWREEAAERANNLQLRTPRLIFEPIAVSFRFSPAVRPRVFDYYKPEQITVCEDGYMLVNAELPNDPMLYRSLLSFGSDVEVLAPAELAERLRDEAMRMVALYNK
ncbi:putative transcriptional regulator [Paenibacillus curdlanolyticus YK9]|uniref:Putative transcriptional regulator n=1 Tax=Paenibacillus curdlanolyticus YK9 TaxID=717606 RepID=E0IAN0_9BACL|nr:YafY family protein [Paenibacillus curdlanolyticus]EFM10434.1 putative transcriptional regulator [Paenibacillus curdlanolyticus YK9]